MSFAIQTEKVWAPGEVRGKYHARSCATGSRAGFLDLSLCSHPAYGCRHLTGFASFKSAVLPLPEKVAFGVVVVNYWRSQGRGLGKRGETKKPKDSER